MTMNELYDILGIIILCSASITCVCLLIVCHKRIEKRKPCEIAATEKRAEYLYDNFHTVLLNSFNTGYYTLVLVIWYINKLDTAPNFVDLMVLLLNIITSVTLVRSSVCSIKNIKRLLSVRKEDLPEECCVHCNKQFNNDLNPNRDK